MVKAAGGEAQLMAKEGEYAHVRLPSGEMRLVRAKCRATIGTIGNTDHGNVKLGKAGRTRHMGVRPTVRGSVMNPVDHPHGGGEGKAPVGHSGPLTPWGKPALGYKTRKKNNRTDKKMITPLDIENKKFSKQMVNGYNVDEVDEFLDEITADYEKLYKENKALKDNAEELHNDVGQYKDIESTLQNTLIIAQKTADEVQNVSEKIMIWSQDGMLYIHILVTRIK